MLFHGVVARWELDEAVDDILASVAIVMFVFANISYGVYVFKKLKDEVEELAPNSEELIKGLQRLEKMNKQQGWVLSKKHADTVQAGDGADNAWTVYGSDPGHKDVGRLALWRSL